ncbi:MAG: suppressor of fused domain protein [Jatrophihabitans sp.]|uniref:suppressor of fused domain protein n=1 Tax=Jatrophihabitans sp. TaxID=1932789 RepID=UPI003F8000F3
MRATVSFLGVEPIDVLRYEPIPGEVVYLSLGMSRRPMTSAADAMTDPGAPRAELMLHLHVDTLGVEGVWRTLAVLAAAPVVEGVVYRPGMTVDTEQPLAPGSRCTGAVVTVSPLEPVPVGDLEPHAADVQVLQLLPATANELAWGRVHGTQRLQELWREQGCDLLDLARDPVTLPPTA